ncbi:MAG: triose-phosphate isomerase [Planctomycetota bacterium]
MVRRPFLAGNWKMHKTRAEAAELAGRLRELVGDVADRDVAVFPPFTALEPVLAALAGSRIEVGAQTCHFEAKGAFTGEVSAEMLADAGVALVLVGHSERREHFGETDLIVRAKLEAVLGAGLKPVVCVGETLEEREAGDTEDVVRTQALVAFEGLTTDQMETVTVAYEPVWAIGTGRTATREQAQEVHAFLRGLLGELFTPELAGDLRIQYGGSVKPDNIGRLMGEPDIDGALVGGASLEAQSFAAIVTNAESR